MGDKNASSDTHVLNDEWTFYLNERPPKGISQEEYERSIHKWGVFSTIEGFWRHMNALDIQKLPTFSTLRMFKSGIKPSWEDPLNSQGGKYVLDTPKNITPRLWRKLVLAIIGGSLTFSDQIIWNRNTEEVVSLEDSLRELREVMGVDEDTSVNYQAHRGSLDFNSHVLERKKHHSNKHHTDSHGEDNGLSNGHVRTKEQSKRKTASVNAEAADSSTTNGATATVDGVSKENGHSSPKAEKRNAERESRKRKEKKEKRDSTNKQHSLADDKMEDEQEEPTVMDQAVAKGTEHAAETEAEPEAKEKDPQADTPSDEDGDDNGESADGFSKSVSARWLTEDDMSEDIYTPYESEGEESLDPGLEGSSDANKRENSSESVEEGRRRTDFKDIRDLPRTRSLSRERGWFDGSGQWQRPNNRQTQPGHRKNGSVGKFDKHENSPIRKTASTADLGPKKYKPGFKINPSNSGNLSRSGSNNFHDHASDTYSTYRHKRSTSTSETTNDHHNNRLYHSQDKMRSIRRPTPPPGFPAGSVKASLEPSPLSNTGVSPRASGLSPRAATRASPATPTAKRTAPPTNPWKSLPATILPATPKASFATIAGTGSSNEVSSTPPASPRAVSPTSSAVRESPAPPPSSPVITPSKPSSYAAMCVDASAESSPSPASGWRAKVASANTTTTTTASVTTAGGAPAKGFKREYFYKPRELVQPKALPPQPQPPQGTAGVASGRRSRSPRAEQQKPADDARETSPRQQKPAAKKEELAQAQKRQPEPAAPREAVKTTQHPEVTVAPPVKAAAPSQKQPGAKQLGGAPPYAHATAPITLAEEVQPKLPDRADDDDEEESDVEVEDASEAMAVEEEADSQVSDVSANDGEDGPGESVEEEGDEGYEEEESVRRTPVKTASRRKPQAKKTPSSKASKRAPSKRTHRRSRGLVIDFLKAHEQEFYFIFAALMLLVLAGTAVLILGLPANPLF